MAIYDTIGHGYARTRRADQRIVRALVDALALPAGRTILDVGAGTGKYSRALAESGFQVIAIEPSEVMRSQAIDHERVRFVPSSAERIPLREMSADGAMVVLAFHHFSDHVRSIEEIDRVVGGGPIVFFTFDPEVLRRFWLVDYFPSLGLECDSSPARLLIRAGLESRVDRTGTIQEFRLPPDLNDCFAAAGWRRPEVYLDSDVRRGISSFSKMSPEEERSGVERLLDDLKSGRWVQTFGSIVKLDHFDAGYRIVKMTKGMANQVLQTTPVARSEI